jgi:hypothetical protein
MSGPSSTVMCVYPGCRALVYHSWYLHQEWERE